jgi:alpha/beta superfamily hydrolase
MMKSVDFIYCEDTQATAEALVSYYAPDPRLDSATLIPRIRVPVIVFAGSEDTVVAGLIEKLEPLADGERIRLEVADGADHFFRDLYSEDIADVMAEIMED